MIRVWIAYEPLVFHDALVAVISQLEGVEIVDDPSGGVDVGIFRLGGTSELQDFFRNAPFPDAKLVAFSPNGEKGFIRYPREKVWTGVQPFSIPQLLLEITQLVFPEK